MNNSARNFFNILGVPSTFAQDPSLLKAHFLERQKRAHPDNFVQASAVEKRQALILSSQINEAYRTLKDPLSRALYWLQCQTELPEVVTLPPAFLMEQMELREAVDEAKISQNPIANLNSLLANVEACLKKAENEFNLFAIAGDLSQARQCAQAWQFYDRLYQNIKETVCQYSN